MIKGDRAIWGICGMPWTKRVCVFSSSEVSESTLLWVSSGILRHIRSISGEEGGSVCDLQVQNGEAEVDAQNNRIIIQDQRWQMNEKVCYCVFFAASPV